MEQLLSRQVLALLHDAGEPAIVIATSWLTPLLPRKVKCSREPMISTWRPRRW